METEEEEEEEEEGTEDEEASWVQKPTLPRCAAARGGTRSAC